MKRTVIVCGHGPGISDAVARRFGREGYAVAIVARRADKLAAAEASLKSAGVEAKAFPCDLANPDAVRTMVADVARTMGPVAVLHWNAYVRSAGDLTTASPAELHAAFDVSVTGLIVAMQASLADLKAQKGAVLVTGGGFAFYDPQVDAAATQWKASGTAIGKAAQHKVVGLLHQRLSTEGVFVGDVVVMGLVRGTEFDAAGHGTIDAADVAEKFWSMAQARTDSTATIAG